MDPRVALARLRDLPAQRFNSRAGQLLRVPTAVVWNRLEGRPRSDDLTRALAAEVRDPLWMLARQWQMGEFRAEDAGMPVQARLVADHARVDRLALGGAHPGAYPRGEALESMVERAPIEPELMTGVALGRRWLELLAAELPAGHPLPARMQAALAVAVPDADAATVEALAQTTDPAEMELRRALAALRAVDGRPILRRVRQAHRAGQAASDALIEIEAAIDDDEKAAMNAAAGQFLDEWRADFDEPEPAQDAWNPQRWEHRAALGVVGARGFRESLHADAYGGDHFDWYSVDLGAALPGADDVPVPEPPAGVAPFRHRRVRALVPAQAQFAGMPDARYWSFEDRRVGFGIESASRTDLAKLVLAEFALAYGNDWYVLPYAAEADSLVRVQAVLVRDNFGVNTVVRPTTERQQARGLAGRFALWTLSRHGNEPAPGAGGEAALFLAPSLGRSQRGEPIDEVLVLRDEMANVVWAIETVTPAPGGGGRDARAAARRLHDAVVSRVSPALPPETPKQAELIYRMMSTVPEHWIPMVSVRREGQSSSDAFLQGAMPRVPPLPPSGDAAARMEQQLVLPRGGILSRNPVHEPNLVLAEELLRSGLLLQRRYQQARTPSGRTSTWLSRSKTLGRGEGGSGLTFDAVSPHEPDV